jgi:hypothetical protein
MTVRYFSDRQKPRGKLNGGAAMFTSLRLAEFSRFLTDKYGEQLPDDDAGRDDAFLFCNTLARTRGGDRSIRQWLALRAPWMAADEIDELVAAAMRLQLKFTADKLAHRIGLDFATRTRLGFKTIGSTDVDKEQRRLIRLQKDRDKKRDMRRAQRKARKVTVSRNRSQPWKDEGIARSTWYARRRTARTETVRNV